MDDQNINTQQSIQQGIADVLGLGILPPEEEARIVAEAGQLIFKSALLRASELLSDDEMKELAALFASSVQEPDNAEKRDAIFAYLVEHVPNFGDIATEETERYFDTVFDERDNENE